MKLERSPTSDTSQRNVEQVACLCTRSVTVYIERNWTTEQQIKNLLDKKKTIKLQ